MSLPSLFVMNPQRRADLQFAVSLLAALAVLAAFILCIHAAL